MRYVVKKQKTKMFDDDVSWEPVMDFKDITVYDDDDTIFTGIIDVDGNQICRSEKAPVGFLSEILECSD
jgi:hypothetical protein